MTAIFPDVEKYKYIDPRQVEAYLVGHGWQQQERLPIYCTGNLIKENGIFILKNPDKFRLVHLNH